MTDTLILELLPATESDTITYNLRYPYSTVIDNETIEQYQAARQWFQDNGIAVVNFAMVISHDRPPYACFTPDYHGGKTTIWYQITD
jgi:hypothetical protein